MEFYKPLEGKARVCRYPGPERIEEGVRLYSEMWRSRWVLQIRGPQGVGFARKRGKLDFYASADLNRDELKQLRGAIDQALSE